MKIFLFFVLLTFSTNAFAAKTISVTISDEEYNAMSVMTVTPEEWVQSAIENKARKMVDRLVLKYSDKQPGKMSKADREALIRTIDLVKERNERRGRP